MIKNSIRSAIKKFGYSLQKLDTNSAYLERLYEKIAGVHGDVVECGVGKMGSFRVLASLVEKDTTNRVLWGFDSFEGFPSPSPEDESPRNPKKGEWKFIEPEDVPKVLLVLGFNENFIDKRIKVVKGFVKDSLPQSSVGDIAFLHLDVDLYESYKMCLHYLFPKVVPGGVVLFDEYMNRDEAERFPGAKKAIDEYLANSKYEMQRDKRSGKFFLVKS